MTSEQVDLEFMHMLIDKQIKNGEFFADTEYDNYDKETDEEDRQEVDMPVFGSMVDPNYELETKWTDIEVDDE